MRVVAAFLAALVLTFSLSACQILNDNDIASIRQEGYQEGKATAEKNSESKLTAQFDAGHDAGYDEGYDKGYDEGRADGLKEAAQKVNVKPESNTQQKPSTSTTTNTASTSSSQTDPQEITVYITDTGEKYHRSGCQYLRESRHAISLSSAKSLGYSACSRCDPPS